MKPLRQSVPYGKPFEAKHFLHRQSFRPPMKDQLSEADEPFRPNQEEVRA